MQGDEFGHMIRHLATQGGDLTPFRYGHIASYDATQHRVRCIIPSMTDQDGTPLLSGWMPMGTLSAGSGFGIQAVYQGGASVANPTAGEQVLIGVFDRQRGVAAVPCIFYHANSKPPATNLPTTEDGYASNASAVQPGDLIISAPPQQAGGANSFVRLRQSGVIEVWSAGALNADVQGDINVTNEGANNISVTCPNGNVTVQAPNGTVNIIGAAVRLGRAITDSMLQLCNSAFATNFSTHTHGGGPPPDQPTTQVMLTQTTVAE